MPRSAVVKCATASTRRLVGRVGQGDVNAANIHVARLKKLKCLTIKYYIILVKP
jgi:hypothetical protein